MRRTLYLILLCTAVLSARAQHIFQGTSLSEALIELDQSSKQYDISFVYDELEDFTVSKTIPKGHSLPDAVREVCGFYPVKVHLFNKEIFVECIRKDRTKLSGKLIDHDRLPVMYANIALFSLSDSTMIGGGVSNEAGDFVIPCSAKEARVRISCMGFKTIERVMAIGQVGTIQMQMENNYLHNVIVTGHPPIIRSKGDRLQYIVANDQFAKGQDMLELLSRVPTVSLSNGYASILGKGRAIIMINGRVIENGNEDFRQKLWSLRAEDIERIEVISIPSSRYESNEGGYINIILKRDQTDGWRGNVSGVIAASDTWSGGANGSISFSSEKFDMTLGGNLERKANITDTESRYTFTGIHKTSITHEKYVNEILGGNGMFRYQAMDNLELGAMVSYRQNKEFMDITDRTLLIDVNTSKGEQYPRIPAHMFSLTMYGDWILDSLGKKLSLTLNHYQEDNHNTFDILTAFPRDDYYRSRCLSKSNYLIQSLKFDALLPYPFATFETGLAYTKIHNDANVSDIRVFWGDLSSWKTDFDYQERTYALYLSGQKSFFDVFMAKAGVRFEHTQLKGFQHFDVTDNSNQTVNPYTTVTPDRREQNNRSYNQLLPFVHLRYNLTSRQLLSLNWNISITRPNFNDLNPFEVYSSSLSIRTGNPSLLPSTTSHLELTYDNGNGLYAALYHYRGRDQVDWITAFHPEVYLQNHNFMEFETNTYEYKISFQQETRPLNCFDSNKFGLYLRYQHKFTPWLNASVEGECYYYDARSDIDPYAFLSTLIDKSSDRYNTKIPEEIGMPDLNGWGKRVGVSADLFLNRQHTLVFNARYDHHFSEFNGLSKYDHFATSHFALHYTLLNDCLKLSLIVHDPFEQHILDATRRYNDNLFREYDKINRHVHSVSLSATYTLGGKKKSRAQRDTKDTESHRAEKRENKQQ